MLHFSITQWLLACAAALLVGFSKTGMPGAGILVVPLLAALFPGRLSSGAMLPMLIFADVFAVAAFQKHTQWSKLRELLPFVAVGFVLGTLLLWKVPNRDGQDHWMNVIIGAIVLAMLVLHLLKERYGERMTPRSEVAVAGAGTCAGFTTLVSNAAGPVMSLYLQGMNMSKNQFIGTSAWFFFIVNVSKLPVYLVLCRFVPKTPMMTPVTLRFDLMLTPMILAGILLGRWFLPRVRQSTFNTLVLVLAGLAAVKLIIG